jgi:hypothetical protein
MGREANLAQRFFISVTKANISEVELMVFFGHN